MNPVGRALKLAPALAGALRRNGAGNVARFAVGFARHHGVAGTLRYALASMEERRRLLSQDEADEPEPAKSAPPTGGGDLDGRYGIDPERWRVFLAGLDAERTRAELVTLSSAVRPLDLAIVVDGSDDAAALERTLASVRALRCGGRSGGPRVLVRPARGDADPPTATLVRSGTEDGLILFLRAGDRVRPDLAEQAAVAVGEGPTDVVTFDMAFQEDGRIWPVFAPGANPLLARHVDPTFGRLMIRASLLADGDAAEPYPSLLRWLDGADLRDAADRWRHIGAPMADIVLNRAQITAGRESLRRRERPVRPTRAREVSVVICTRDKGHLVRQLVRALDPGHPRWAQVLLIANSTTNPYALDTLADLAREPAVTVLHRDEPFNFSRLCNAGARLATGERLLFLNDDIVPVSEDWLEVLLGDLDEPGTGIAGPLLLYPDERVQHAGMYLGLRNTAGHTLRGARLPGEDYLFFASAPRQVSAVTGAALMVTRGCFEALGGFDEQLATYVQDVDLCLRARHAGFVNVFDPRAVLIHMESASLGEHAGSAALNAQRAREHARFTARWGDFLHRDDLHPAGFDLQDESLRTLRTA